MKRYFGLLLLLTSSVHAGPANDHWVTSWTTPQPLIRNPPAPPRPPPAPAPTSAAASPQATSPAPPAGPDPVAVNINARGFHDQTIRMIVHTSIGGHKLRIRLASPFGGAPVLVGNAHVAVRTTESGIVPQSDRALSFNGRPGCTIGAGMVILSDPIDFDVPGQSDLMVSLYLPGDTGPPSAHNGLHTAYVSKGGDAGTATVIRDATTTQFYYWLAGVDVLAPADASLVVALGDSITEGWRSTADTNRSWPAVLSKRLAGRKDTAHVAVANMGIGGNRILRDGTGASALARFDRDVLGLAGVKWLIVLEGINDIGHADTDSVSADDLIGGLKQIIERAHTQGIKVMGATLPPFEGARYFREDGEAIRGALNAWIRGGGAFDAVVDFDAATRDPTDPRRLRAEFDPGDHLHPNDAGYQAMADAIDLPRFAVPYDRARR
jgi:lysophospholipase L1-like esterase